MAGIPRANAEFAARIAELALSSSTLQACSWRCVSLLADIATGNATDLDPDQARQFAEQALEMVITAEVVGAREARP